MVYITLANSNNIIFNSDISNLDLEGEVYKIPIYFFSKYEKNSLLAIQELLKDPETYFREIYTPIKREDTYSLISEGKKPCYHTNPNCKRLHADYENYEIPGDIVEQGPLVVNEFRKWFKTVQHLIETKPDAFVMHLESRWGIVTNPRSISHENSGTTQLDNYSLDKLENKIDRLIKDAGRFYYNNKKNKSILSKYSKMTYLANNKSKLKRNTTGYSDQEVKNLLREYNANYKKPLKNLLIEYYRLKLNPEIKMQGYLLENLGFVKCRHCSDETDYIEAEIE
jgi:hypothetical protein